MESILHHTTVAILYIIPEKGQRSK